MKCKAKLGKQSTFLKCIRANMITEFGATIFFQQENTLLKACKNQTALKKAHDFGTVTCIQDT
jgi:hypothetical protein